jgi:hypothetical protein
MVPRFINYGSRVGLEPVKAGFFDLFETILLDDYCSDGNKYQLKQNHVFY